MLVLRFQSSKITLRLLLSRCRRIGVVDGGLQSTFDITDVVLVIIHATDSFVAEDSFLFADCLGESRVLSDFG